MRAELSCNGGHGDTRETAGNDQTKPVQRARDAQRAHAVLDGVLAAARKNNIGIIAKRPIANAPWRAPEAHAGIYREYNAPYIERFSTMALDLKQLGFKGDWPELALRFTLSIEGIHTAIIGTTNPENANANVRYANAGTLAGDVVKKLREAFRRADPDRKWNGET